MHLSFCRKSEIYNSPENNAPVSKTYLNPGITPGFKQNSQVFFSSLLWTEALQPVHTSSYSASDSLNHFWFQPWMENWKTRVLHIYITGLPQVLGNIWCGVLPWDPLHDTERYQVQNTSVPFRPSLQPWTGLEPVPDFASVPGNWTLSCCWHVFARKEEAAWALTSSCPGAQEEEHQQESLLSLSLTYPSQAPQNDRLGQSWGSTAASASSSTRSAHDYAEMSVSLFFSAPEEGRSSDMVPTEWGIRY